MNGSTTLDGRAGCGRWRPWLAPVTLVALAALAVPDGGPGNLQPRFELAATDVGALPSGWTARPPTQVARVGLDVATASGEIFAIGGFNPDRPGVFRSVEAQPVGGTLPWRNVATMPTARANAAAAALDGAVYVAGGFTDDQTLDVVERFDPARGTWSASRRLPAPRGAAAAAALGGRLYVAGGLIPLGPTEDEITASVVSFDPRTKAWTAVAPMPTPRWRLRLVAAGGKLYAIGGQSRQGSTLSTVERYDPDSNTWTAVAPMNQDRGVPGAVAVNRGSQRLIVVVGGCQFFNGQRRPFLTSTEVYNLDTGTWRPLEAQLPHGRCSLGSAVKADGTVLAIAGGIEIGGIVSATSNVDALTF